MRALKLSQDPLCERCKASGLLVPATEVHHKAEVRDAPELALDLANLESLCLPCHSSETARRQANGTNSSWRRSQ
jgi:5-methylcytosine-specific restriction endonuclease McrA